MCFAGSTLLCSFKAKGTQTTDLFTYFYVSLVLFWVGVSMRVSLGTMFSKTAKICSFIHKENVLLKISANNPLVCLLFWLRIFLIRLCFSNAHNFHNFDRFRWNWYQKSWFIKIFHIKRTNHKGCRPLLLDNVTFYNDKKFGFVLESLIEQNVQYLYHMLIFISHVNIYR